MSNQILRAKVISILDSQRLIIDAGLSHGVLPGMQFYIYEMGEEIVNPETNESLGQLEVVKAHLEAFLAQEKFTVLIPVPAPGSQPAATVLSAQLAQVGSTSSRETMRDRGQLNVRQDQIRGVRYSNPIALGDMARSVFPLDA